jgi:hypothetical protein
MDPIRAGRFIPAEHARQPNIQEANETSPADQPAFWQFQINTLR